MRIIIIGPLQIFNMIIAIIVQLRYNRDCTVSERRTVDACVNEYFDLFPVHMR